MFRKFIKIRKQTTEKHKKQASTRNLHNGLILFTMIKLYDIIFSDANPYLKEKHGGALIL